MSPAVMQIGIPDKGSLFCQPAVIDGSAKVERPLSLVRAQPRKFRTADPFRQIDLVTQRLSSDESDPDDRELVRSSPCGAVFLILRLSIRLSRRTSD